MEFDCQIMRVNQTNSVPMDWIFLAKSYLALAYIGICEISEKKYCKQPSYLWRVSKQVYDAKLLLIPVIWNIKHAIELVLKANSFTFKKKYSKTHKLSDLKDELADILCINKVGEDKKFDELVCIVDKYYKLEIFNGKLVGKQTIFDIDNDILRYPEGNKANFKLNIKLFGESTNKEIAELRDDIELINRRLNIPCDFGHLKPFWADYSKK